MNPELYLSDKITLSAKNIVNPGTTKESVFEILVRITILVLMGSIFISTSSLLFKAGAGIISVVIFLSTMQKGDLFSVLVQLFICNHFVLGPEYGGVCNWLFTFSLIIFFVAGNSKSICFDSSFNSTTKWCLAGLFIIQLLSIIAGNDFLASKKIIGTIAFSIIMLIFHFSSSIKADVKDYYRFLSVICIFFIYMFLASLNQQTLLITADYPFFPTIVDSTEFDKPDLIRSSGTFKNTEAYAEYSLSIIAMLLPGIFSGSIKKVNKGLYILCLLTSLIAVLSIVLSATRSSMLLLPVLIFLVFLNSTTLKRGNLFLIMLLTCLFIAGNSFFHIVDFDVFSKRNEEDNIKSLTLSKVISGEDINRGPLFMIALENIKDNGGILGGGYFPSPQEYHDVHFKHDTYGYADYHNLYLSAAVMWGVIGAILFVTIFLSLYIAGVRLYKKVKYTPSFYNDLLLGFNIMIILFLINEYKIQFNRNVNYFTLMLILIGVYSSLMKYVASKVAVRTYR